MGKLSPMMQQYVNTKEEYKDCILFYRLGDFYEMFFEDAVTASRELEITLTGKDCGLKERAPMCGVPFHSVDGYLNKLVAKGYKVAICEQVEDPKTTRGLVKREVVRVVTPGTNLDTQALDETKNNYLMCIVYIADTYGVAITDITTGSFFVTEVDSERKLLDEINKFMPSEIICNESICVSAVDLNDWKNRLGISVYILDSWYFDDESCSRSLLTHFNAASYEGLGLADYNCGVISAGALMQYLYETQKNALSHLTQIKPYCTDKYMIIDSSTRRNLELVETLREKKKKGSLLWVVDKTKTAMGARLLRNFVEQPLIEKSEIEARFDAIEELNESIITREEIREYLGAVYDLERLISKISYKSANPRDLIAFKASLSMLPALAQLFKQFNGELLTGVSESFDTLDDLYDLIERAIEDEPPVSAKDGNVIKLGFNEYVDELKNAKTEGKNWLAKLEANERERTGIRNLKIKYNKVFGYYLEVTNSYKDLVPDNYVRKQTMSNAERYITSELKELEDKILGAEEKLSALEYELFSNVRDKISDEVVRVQKTAYNIALIDAVSSMAYVSEKNNFVRPSINLKGIIDIKDGRHPVVEQMLNNDMFISNDTYLDLTDSRLSVITGPNMAGKSTYMRQTALIVLMAHLGCFVPARNANICITDRIFTRVGASDDLASGQSTFMVEMTEVANILRNATRDSLIILDEIGRGTSTFDGLSIAWSVVEHISNTKILGAKTLFATHYHELTELEGKISGVNNYCIAVKEKGDDIVFLRKIVKGGADKSYGIQVARLAGVPESVLNRASELVEELIKTDITERVREIGVVGDKKKSAKKLDEVDMAQMSLFDTVKNEDIVDELVNLDLSNITPIDALNTLYSLQNKIKNRW